MPNKKVVYIFSSILFSLVSISVLIYVILHPSNPEFQLRDVGASHLVTLSSPQQLLLQNSTIRFTLISKNPNAHVGLFYDNLRACAAFRGQFITAVTDMPPFFQGNHDTNILSAFLYGTGVSTLPDSSFRHHDRTVGEITKIVVKIKLVGSIRWKVGSWVSNRHRAKIDCVAAMGFRQGMMRSKQPTKCSINLPPLM
ncbi:harpin-induced like protein 12 [Zostera marina]|uniref:Harpin-induced like protein 12 n=1 Tax=Zostera marina TaxID=29655 RepID=A0A0K9PUK8_ZOSMR|nr:harpin-induced like protein 12 [Zostera marina]